MALAEIITAICSQEMYVLSFAKYSFGSTCSSEIREISMRAIMDCDFDCYDIFIIVRYEYRRR